MAEIVVKVKNYLSFRMIDNLYFFKFYDQSSIYFDNYKALQIFFELLNPKIKSLSKNNL